MIGIEVEGIEQVQEKLKRIADPRALSEITSKVAEFLNAEFKKYPSPRSISRKEAYGKSFFSDKQRRYFFWALKEGLIQVPYTRTRNLQKGWQVMKFGTTDHIVVNETPYASQVQGSGMQSRMMGKIGWKDTDTIVDKKKDKIRNIAGQVLDKWLRKLGFSTYGN